MMPERVQRLCKSYGITRAGTAFGSVLIRLISIFPLRALDLYKMPRAAKLFDLMVRKPRKITMRRRGMRSTPAADFMRRNQRQRDRDVRGADGEGVDSGYLIVPSYRINERTTDTENAQNHS